MADGLGVIFNGVTRGPSASLLRPLLLFVVVTASLRYCVASAMGPATMRNADDTEAAAAGYSYSRFVGPVSGPEQQVYVHDAFSGATRLDYVARPEYQFAYGVEDADARVMHNRQETRDGNAVEGVYSVVDPDGNLRVVKYTADDLNGFRAEVITNGGKPILHGGVPELQQHVPRFPTTSPAAVREQYPQYHVHESAPPTAPQQQQPSADDTEELQGEPETHHDGERQEDGNGEEGDDEEEGEEAYTSYEDASAETHSHEANSDEEDEEY